MNLWRTVHLGGVLLAALCAAGLVVFLQVGRTSKPLRAASRPAGAAPADYSEEPIQPIPREVQGDRDKVALGRRLFHDPRLSRDNTVSCASCHDLSLGGTDHLPRSLGINGAKTGVNSPTVFNSGLSFKQFWDGRAESLEDQVEGPVTHPGEMGSNWPDVIDKLRQDPGYAATFAGLYRDGIQAKNIKDAIATFERSLLTPNSRFDHFLRGDRAALSDDEKEGYRLFKTYGCASCHQGTLVGGNMFGTLGVMADYFADRGNPTKADLGRFNVTGDEGDRHKFKVPSLRNIALTGPYFHDGDIKTLERAVNAMAKYQLGRHLSAHEVFLIVKFLKTLTGEYQGERS